MSGPSGSVLSLRVTKDERAKLHAIKRERGCQNLSQTIRLLIGLPRSGPFEEIEGADDIESVSHLVKLVVLWSDRLDEQHQMLTKIARHLEIPLQERPRASRGRPQSNPNPETPIPVNGRAEADDDLDAMFAFRGGHQHPELPDGFARS